MKAEKQLSEADRDDYTLTNEFAQYLASLPRVNCM
jgi:hypothetical protein